MLTEALTDDPDDLTSDEIAEIRVGIGRGMEAVVAGRVRSAEDYMADVQKWQTGLYDMEFRNYF